MYVPKKLQENFKLIKEEPGTNIIVKGVLSCCGQHDFTILYVGELETNWFGRKDIFPKGENTIVLAAKCNVCGNEIEVFNSLTDGYDGVTGGHDDYIDIHSAISSLEFNTFNCTKCSASNFLINISFEYPDDLENDGIQEYENAFSSIWISPTCTSCKKTYKNLIDMETA